MDTIHLTIAILISGCLQLLIILIVSLQVIFKTVFLTLDQWWMVIILPFSLILYVELLKLMKLSYK